MSPKCIWLTGLPSAGKTTLAAGLEKKLLELGYNCIHLDGDIIRKGINSDLGFSMEHRKENIRRVAELSHLQLQNHSIPVCSFIAPTREIRELARSIIGKDLFIEVFIDTPKEICALRDPKGMYAKAFKGEIKEFTGISSPWEPPLNPSLTIHTLNRTADECVEELLAFVLKKITGMNLRALRR
jgi:adenylyl-sulfate kinase